MKLNVKDHNELLAFIVGTMSLIIVVYRIGYLMIPMFLNGIEKENIKLIFQSFTLLI